MTGMRDMPSIMLLDLGREFRGGQRQTLALAKGLMSRNCNVILACRGDAPLRERARLHSVPLLETTYSLAGMFPEALSLVNRVEESAIDVLHASDSHSHTLAVIVKRMTARLKLVVTARTVFSSSGWFSRRFKYGGGGVDRFVAISRAVKNNLVSRGAGHEKIEIIPSGIDRAIFNQNGRTETDRFTIGTACALEKNKGVGQILKSLKLLNKSKTDWMCRIAGTGPDREILAKQASSSGIADKVEFCGFVDDMPDFYRGLDAYILASRSEGLGSSLIEAGACGALPVGADVGGVSEVIDDGIDGFLFEYSDVGRLSQILYNLSDNRDERKKMLSRFENKLEKFDINNMVSSYLDLYLNLMRGFNYGR